MIELELYYTTRAISAIAGVRLTKLKIALFGLERGKGGEAVKQPSWVRMKVEEVECRSSRS